MNACVYTTLARVYLCTLITRGCVHGRIHGMYTRVPGVWTHLYLKQQKLNSVAIDDHKLYGLTGTCTNLGYRQYRQIKIRDGQKNNSIRNTITRVGTGRF